MAHRSASGSSATARSASTRAASSSRASTAPGSSGLGNGTVGKSGSGANWLATVCTSGKPARGRATTPGGPAEVVLDDVRIVGCDRCAGDLVGVRRLRDRAFDLAVGRRDDLHAAVQI